MYQPENDETFRDSIATVTQEGKRNWIFAKKPFGKFYNYRSVVSYLLIIIKFGAPFIKIDGHPFILLDIVHRKFIIFGIHFGPHDFHLFGLAMIAVFVSVFLFTVVYGRIFCGWICPQTVFLEMVFRRIEYLIEGDANKQRALQKAPWTASKIAKKFSKQIIFAAISIMIGNIFLAYFVGVDKLWQMVTDGPSAHSGTFIFVVAFSAIFHFVFSWFREQACTIVCPYGRLQGVMLDQNSIVIAYDHIRGEPRGKLKKSEDQTGKGDCIDCHLCVDVCPTGIDIRNGTQLECVNCTACIDVCDDVMSKIGRPKKLIKYASKNEIETRVRKIWTPKAIGYTTILILLLSLITFLLLNRSDFELSILRTPGLLYQQMPDGRISNIYDVKIINKTFNELPAELKLKNIEGEIRLIGKDLNVDPQGVAEAKFFVILGTDQIKKLNTPIEIGVISEGREIDVIKTSFLGKVDKNSLKGG